MVELRHAGARATVAERGAELLSYTGKDGREYLWNGDPAVWSGHSPLLFPVIGNAMQGRVRIGGQTYEMPKHGLVRGADFSLRAQGEDFAEFGFAADAETRRSYPFDFELLVRHTLLEDGFSTSYIVENHGNARMPFCIGGHPAFVCPMREGARFEDYVVRFAQAETGENTLVNSEGYIRGKEMLPGFQNSDTLSLDYGLIEVRDTLIFENLRSRKVWLVHRESGEGLSFAFPHFDLLALWTKPGMQAPYLCIEPWSGLPAVVGESGNFEDKPYVRWLAPGERYQTGYEMRIETGR